MSNCPVCDDTKRVQIRVRSFHAAGTTYHYDCPSCRPINQNLKNISDFIETHNTSAGRADNGYYNDLVKTIHELVDELLETDDD